ncbi:hypothetical protein OSB04_010334 [Centaurea solstitialis]|uniref:RWP-RK domain-containing protein n=1 Tax=Centaurea solstitialis TaxID=347529 RepID=A0AA38T7C6_9ASTR|nr:hypothetical protein OSB04_010334 [Centaurea solstitialis]
MKGMEKKRRERKRKERTFFPQLSVQMWEENDDPQLIQHKIKCAFQNLQLDDFYRSIVQFWAPVTSVCGRQLLTTSNQPFALPRWQLYRDIEEHRIRCLNYQYNINVNKVDVVEDEPTIITNGAPASAFLNRIPELLLINGTIHLMKKKNKDPLLFSALECRLGFSVMVPVFYPSQSDCVGVVECSTYSSTDLFPVFVKLNVALEEQGLKTFHAQHHLPYKTIPSLQNVKDEIHEALEIILPSHRLPLCQVSIPYEVENQVAFSSSLQDTPTKQMVLLKLTSYNCEDFACEEDLEHLEEYSTAHDRLPMKLDIRYAGKTLENYERLFIHNTLDLDDDNLKQLASCSEYGCSCFVICLRSTKTGDLDYVFEFFWNPCKPRNNVIVLEQLLLTLKRCLPSFKFASSTDFGDEIDILDVNNSEGSENKYIKLFQRNNASPKRGTQTEVEESSTNLKAKRSTKEKILSREQIESQFGQTLEEAAPKLNVSVSTLKRKCNRLGIQWHGKDLSKRNVKHSYKNQSNTNEEEDQGGAIQDPSSAIIRETPLDENILTINAEYEDDRIKFTLPISSATYEAIHKGIFKKFKLDCGAHYKLKYLDDKDNKWFLFNDDEDVTLCTKNKRTVYLTVMKM